MKKFALSNSFCLYTNLCHRTEPLHSLHCHHKKQNTELITSGTVFQNGLWWVVTVVTLVTVVYTGLTANLLGIEGFEGCVHGFATTQLFFSSSATEKVSPTSTTKFFPMHRHAVKEQRAISMRRTGGLQHRSWRLKDPQAFPPFISHVAWLRFQFSQNKTRWDRISQTVPVLCD